MQIKYWRQTEADVEESLLENRTSLDITVTANVLQLDGVYMFANNPVHSLKRNFLCQMLPSGGKKKLSGPPHPPPFIRKGIFLTCTYEAQLKLFLVPEAIKNFLSQILENSQLIFSVIF
jgi:hypothetical protein